MASKEPAVSALPRAVVLTAAAVSLSGCQMLASLAEDPTLRALAIFVAVAAVPAFLFAKMRR
jgi:hypothetical protein